MTIIVTGSSGFVGQHLVRHISRLRLAPVLTLLRGENLSNYQCVDVVIHLAARVHIMKDQTQDPLAEFRKTNTDLTLNLAKQAVQQGVKRFIFVSSAKVNGELTADKPFTEGDSLNPQDPYAISKYEAEEGLKEIAANTGIEVVIIRPPLVYGPGVRANFLNLMKFIHKGWPFPFAHIPNQRSLISVDNLVDFILTAVTYPKAANETFLISDGDDVSTTDLIRHIAYFMNKKQMMLPIPAKLAKKMLDLSGFHRQADRLFGSLQLDISKAKTLLNWRPPVSLKHGLEKTVYDFLGQK